MSSTTNGARAPKTIRLRSALFVGVICALVAFVVGTRSDAMQLQFWKSNPGSQSAINNNQLEEVYQTLKQKYAGQLPNNQELSEGAARGLVAATGDPYTVFFSAAEAKQFADSLSGNFSGIGAELSIRNKVLTILSVIDGSPAKKAGLLQGDVIVKVNNQDTADWSVDKAVSNIRGEKGTNVTLTIVRDGESKDVTITRDNITDPSVKSSVVDGIGVMRISRFSDTDTTTLARAAARDFKAKNVRGVILDLRGNGGGYVTAAQDVSSLWLGDGKTVVSERKDGKVIQELKTSGDAILEGVPTIVLIDGGSASASEIVAGALHDHKAARLVGEKSFGKGSVQEIEELSGGAQLKVTVALWYTPNGKNINKEGIAPDVEVKLTNQQLDAGEDPQQSKAMELLAG